MSVLVVDSVAVGRGYAGECRGLTAAGAQATARRRARGQGQGGSGGCAGPARTQTGWGVVAATVLVGAVIMIAMFALWSWRTDGLHRAGVAQHPASSYSLISADGEQAVLVQPGESLSDVAARIPTDIPVAVMVTRLSQLNGLDGTQLRPGQLLRVPGGQ